MITSLRFTLAALLFALLAGPALAADDEKDWRDEHDRLLREKWDELEDKAAPPIENLTGWLNTTARSWKELQGKVVIIDFWATWCGPCIAQIPKLQGLHDKYAKDGLVILGVHSSAGFEAMPQFVEQKKLPWAFAADSKKDLGEALNVKFIPTYFIVDKKGTLRVAGANRDKLEDIVKVLLKEEGKTLDPKELVGKYPKAVEKRLYAKTNLVGKPGPKIEVDQWLNGEPKTQGKLVIVELWATWCPSCMAATARLNQIQETFKDDVAVLAISDETADDVKAFLAKYEVNLAVGVDSQARLKNALGVEAIPHVLIISTDGIVRWQGFPLDASDKLSDALIRRLLQADAGIFAKNKDKAKDGK